MTPLAIPHEAYSVVPAELGDVGIDARLHHRARLARYGKMWLLPEQVVPTYEGEVRDAALRVVRVIGETRHRVRVVIDDDRAARYAVWIDRADLQPAIVGDVELAAGVWLERGAPVDADEPRAGLRRVRLRDLELAVAGAIDERAVGAVWLADGAALVRTGAGLQHATASLANGTPIRSSAGGPIIATTIADAVGVIAAAPRDGWVAIELRLPYAHVRGYVAAASVGAASSGGLGSIGLGNIFTISDTDRVELPAGACLFDGPEQETLGVTIQTRVRYAHRPRPEHPGWWLVYVGSPWASVALYAHELARDAAAPSWDLCTAAVPSA